jgi:hypothetical protein
MLKIKNWIKERTSLLYTFLNAEAQRCGEEKERRERKMHIFLSIFQASLLSATLRLCVQKQDKNVYGTEKTTKGLSRIIACVLLLVCLAGAPRLTAQQRSYIIPDVCAPGMGTYIEIIGESTSTKRGQFGKDSIYANNPGDAVRVELDNPEEDAGKIIIGPVTVAWEGRMVATHVFVLPNVQPNASYWKDLRKDFRIPIRVIVRGRTDSIANLDTIYG